LPNVDCRFWDADAAGGGKYDAGGKSPLEPTEIVTTMQFKKKEKFWQDEKLCSFLWRSEMMLYKYRSLTNFEHVLDIILNQRLYCSTYSELNDPFEGVFETTLHFPPTKEVVMGFGFTALLRQQCTYSKVEDFFGGEIDKIKICSLSSDLNDVRLWSYYADGHKGIVFEIDFSGLETKLHEVHYSEKLPWGVSLEVSIPLVSGWTKPHDVLSRKTNHWKFESEYRIIEESKDLAEGKYFDIKSKIKAIYLGTRANDIYPDKVKLLTKIVEGKIPIYTTKINPEKIIVEPDKLIERQEESP
jgi:hypothetical protein